MTDHSTVESYIHSTFPASATANWPTATMCDTWCTNLDTYIGQGWPDATSALKSMAVCLTVVFSLLPLYRKGAFNGFADQAGSEQSGTYQFTINTLIPPFVKEMLSTSQHYNETTNYISFSPYG